MGADMELDHASNSRTIQIVLSDNLTIQSVGPIKQIDQITAGPLNRWTVKQLDHYTAGPLNSWTAKQLDCQTAGPPNSWTINCRTSNSWITKTARPFNRWTI